MPQVHYPVFHQMEGVAIVENGIDPREALENVLIPITPEKQVELLKKAGFKKVEMIFRWYNFACYLGVK